MRELAIRVVLVEPEKGGNIGSVARAMKNFQLDDLRIVNPKTRINSEAKRFAMKGLDVLNSAKTAHRLPQALRNVDMVVGTSSVAARSASNLSRVSITPEELAAKAQSAKGNVAIVFGRESSGLSNSEVEACDIMVTIPASQEYNVLNMATAASIVFYEIYKRGKPKRSRELASKPARVRLLLQFDHLMKMAGFPPHKRPLAHRAFRNVVSRSLISPREASLLLGVLRKASGNGWKGF